MGSAADTPDARRDGRYAPTGVRGGIPVELRASAAGTPHPAVVASANGGDSPVPITR